MSGSETDIETLLGQDVSIINTISREEEQIFDASYYLLQKNLDELAAMFEGEIDERPILVVQSKNEDEFQKKSFEVTRLLHNYLSSLYSFNEHALLLINDNTPEEVTLSASNFVPSSSDDNKGYYSLRLALLRGLRIDFQHGDFSGLTWEKYGDIDGILDGMEPKFDRQAFRNGGHVDDPDRYIKHTNKKQSQYIIPYIARFHRNCLNEFAESVMDCLTPQQRSVGLGLD